MVPGTDERGRPGCGHTEADVGSISRTGASLGKTFDI